MNIQLKWRLLGAVCLLSSTAALAQEGSRPAPLLIEEQGSFMVGGTAVETPGTFRYSDYLNPAGQKAYADHAYAFYQIPVDAKKLPLVFLHGGGSRARRGRLLPTDGKVF
ncbi:MAG: hypothetical protein LUE99_10690 [Bacteroides sp.]|nr:hypothetical protein [Bacteroides sp.]